MNNKIRIIEEPVVIPLMEMTFIPEGVSEFVEYLQERRPECLPEKIDPLNPLSALLPCTIENGRQLTDNEMGVELSGRTCYYSFGEKSGQKSNQKYLSRMLGEEGKIPHASVFYHAKMQFFFGGLSRRVSHELIRHYVGADRSEEGSPSQESTRYTHHPGWFVAHPRDLEAGGQSLNTFYDDMSIAYTRYVHYIRDQVGHFEREHKKEPQGMDRKRIYESAAQRLPGAAATSFTWTTNPMALSKMFRERCDYAADLEIQRFANKLRKISVERWPHLFGQRDHDAVEEMSK